MSLSAKKGDHAVSKRVSILLQQPANGEVCRTRFNDKAC